MGGESGHLGEVRAFSSAFCCFFYTFLLKSMHLGKLEAWSAAGGPPLPGIAELSATAWKGNLPEHLNGIMVLGAPLGHPAFMQAFADERASEEECLLEALPDLPDLQAAWALLLHCASPRANHLLRLLPRSSSKAFAESHDEAMRSCLSKLLLQARPLGANSRAWQIAGLPHRLGGLGLRKASRTAPAAYWAAWPDALPEVSKRFRALATRLSASLAEGSESNAPCLQEASAAGQLLTDEGWTGRPEWREVLAGARPEQTPQGEAAEPGEWRHGWQYHASSIREHHFRARSLLPRLPRPVRALLRSSSGPGAGQWLAALPVSPGTTLQPAVFQVALRRRLRLPLGLGVSWCPARHCRLRVDTWGDHLASCPCTGLLQRRAKPLERAWQTVLREAGARAVPQQMMRDMDLAIRATDGRQMDVVAYRLTSVPLCGDATLVSPLDIHGQPKYGADEQDGAALAAARRRKQRRYPELAAGERARLVVLGCETGGRWDSEAWELLSQLAYSKCQTAPARLRRSARLAWHRRWASMVSIAAQGALAASLASPPALQHLGTDSSAPDLVDVLCQAREGPGFSRLAWRH